MAADQGSFFVLVEHNIPDPDDKVAWPLYRNAFVREKIPEFLDFIDITPFDYQAEFLEPSDPWDIDDLKFIQLGGGKRIGKSLMLAVKALPYLLIPGAEVRLYGVEHENCSREFSHICKLLFDERKGIVRHIPELLQGRTQMDADPSKGKLDLRFQWGSRLVSRSLQRDAQWLGEPIDLAIICEPGLFDSFSIFTEKIESNLQDRSGLCCSAGTVDAPWMKDVHDECCIKAGREHGDQPDMYCVCEIPMWANESLNLTEEKIRFMRQRMTKRQFAINVLGRWEVYEDVAYEKWDEDRHVKIVPLDTWKKLKKCDKAGWEHFFALDTGGRYNAIGEYVVNPQGFAMMIDEWTTYEYRGGQITQTWFNGFRPWYQMVLAQVGETIGEKRNNALLTIIDRTSQMKADLDHMGVPYVDSDSGHEFSVNAANEYLAADKMVVIRPEGREPFMIEREIPRARWKPGESGAAGRATLERGDDHSADQFRYFCAWRPIAHEWLPERPLSIVEKDLAQIARNKLNAQTSAFGADRVSMGSMGDI